MNRRPAILLFWLMLAVLAGGAIFLRFEKLTDKPLHTDEAVQAYKVSQLLDGTGYTYDPVDHHGPVMYYLAAGACKIAGQNSFREMTVAPLRVVTALFGLALVFATWLWKPCGVRSNVLLVAMALGAVSPMAVYYARYFIQETIFVGCFWAMVPLVWRLMANEGDREKTKWFLTILAGISFGLTISLKETWVLMIAATVGAALLTALIEKPTTLRYSSAKFLLGVMGVAFAIAAAFYASFGKNPAGALDAVMAYAGYFQKASGGPHDKPFGWYLPLLFGTHFGMRELLAGIGFLLLIPQLFLREFWIGKERQIVIFSALSSVALLFLYSFIAYKTPWLMLGVLPPLWLAAAFGYVGIARLVSRKIPVWASALALLVPLFFTAKSAHFFAHRFSADERNRMAYVHATDDMNRVELLVRDIARVAPKKDFRIQVYSAEYWPLPWYLRFWRTEFFPPMAIDPTAPIDAPVVITDNISEEAVAPLLKVRYRTDFIGLRPNVLLILRLREDLLDASIAQRSTQPNE